MFSLVNKFLSVEGRLWSMNPRLKSLGPHFKDPYSCFFFTIYTKWKCV